ncbi:6-bladed beta-propeller [Sphingobacterium spiritivorum]
MTINFKHILLGVIFIIFIACNTKHSREIDTQDAIDTIVFNNKSVRADSLPISNYTFLPLQTTEESLFAIISKLIHKNGKFYILDAHVTSALFIFSDKGEFLYKIDNKGRGFGQYITLNDFDVDEQDNVYISDMQSRKIIKFSNGAPQNEIQLSVPFLEFAINKNVSENLVLFKTFGDNDVDYILSTYNQQDSKISRIQKADPLFDKSSITVFSPFGLYKSPNYLSYYKRFSNSIYRYDYTSLKRRMMLDTDLLPTEDNIKQAVKARNNLSNVEFIKDITEIYENNDYLYFCIHKGNQNISTLFSKITKTAIFANSVSRSIPMTSEIFNVSEQGFVAAYYPNFENKENLMDSLKLNGIKTAELKKIEKISPGDNPVLVFINF